MTFVPAILAALKPIDTTYSIWNFTAPRGTFDEGSTMSFQMTCGNALPGVSKIVWKLAGGKAGDGAWAFPWSFLWTQAVQGRGITITSLKGSDYGATIALLFEIGDGYDGLPVVITNTVLNNKVTEVQGGTPGQLQITQQLVFPAGASGPTPLGNGSPFFIRDTSKTPPGTPTYHLMSVAADGVTAVLSVNEGDTFYLKPVTENMIPGTIFEIAAVNVGQYAIAGGFQAAIKAAAEAAGCKCSTAYADRGNYNGGVITTTAAYSDAKPILIPITITKDHVTTGARQLDFLTFMKADGDPNNKTVNYGGTITIQIADTSVEPTPSYWRLTATLANGQATYGVNSPTGASVASVTLASTGTVPAGFEAALAAAVAATPGLTYSNGVITSDATWSGVLNWSVAAPATGKHSLRLINPTNDSFILVGDAAIYFAAPALPARPAFVTGVNMSGGDFGGTVRPGAYGTNYRYPAYPDNPDPALQHQEIDYYVSKKAGIIRLPVLWERIQDALFGPLSSPGTLATWYGRLDMDRIDDFINYATSRGLIVLLDVHNYIYGFGSRVGFNSNTPTTALVDLWEKLANRYAGNPRVWFGIMNEPNGIAANEIRDIMEWVLNSIRGRTNALNHVLVTGGLYSRASAWVTNGFAAAFEGFADPAKNFGIELHSYLDSDQKGEAGTCDLNSYARAQAAITWARARGIELHIGEFNGGDPSVAGQGQCGIEVPKMCQFLFDNRDVVKSWTAWGGGAGWKQDYIFRLTPLDLNHPVDTPQLAALLPYFTTI